MAYVIGIDQSTQGTKAMLFDESGALLLRVDKSHRQLVDEHGWVEHDPEEIYANLIELIGQLLQKSNISGRDIAAVGVCNQRETAMAWERATGKPVYNAIVWQCARAAAICDRVEAQGFSERIHAGTGIRLSPYYSAAKLAWILDNVSGVRARTERGEICMGTMDSYLIYRLTHGAQFRTDFSNASRTQLFNLLTLTWDADICAAFGIPLSCLAEVTDSDGYFGETDFEGLLPKAVPINGVMGDSHGALFGQGCLERGMMKATYGTGSSIMMNVGEKPIITDLGIVSSLAWKTRGRVHYVLEGNINYTGAVITWLKDDMHLLESAAESEACAIAANPEDRCYLIPAFSGLGAPYWRSDVSAAIVGMKRTTKRNEVVRAGLECIAYQITDVVKLMQQASGIATIELRVDGGATGNAWLMQFQADILNANVFVPKTEELSGVGVAYAAGLGAGIYTDDVFSRAQFRVFEPQIGRDVRERKYEGWKTAVAAIL